MPGTVKLWYFKSTGKFYSAGEYETEESDYKVPKEVEAMLDIGTLPGLRGGAKFHVVCVPPDYEVPSLILCDLRKVE